MYLLYNLSKQDEIHVALFDGNRAEHMREQGKNRDLLAVTDRLLRTNRLKPDDVNGIMVVVGSGGFTSTRVATVAANSFAYVLGIPLLAIQEDQVDHVQELIPELLKQPAGRYVSAQYSAEPRITAGKQKIVRKSYDKQSPDYGA